MQVHLDLSKTANRKLNFTKKGRTSLDIVAHFTWKFRVRLFLKLILLSDSFYKTGDKYSLNVLVIVQL